MLLKCRRKCLLLKSSTSGDLLKEITTLLSPVAGELSQNNALEMLEKSLGLSHTELLLAPEKLVSSQQKEQLSGWCHTRLSGVPLPYVLGSAYFYNSEVLVSKATLIPRHDTENLIEAILVNLPEKPQHFLEIGTGTGCIPKALILERPTWSGITVDISEEALEIAKQNLPSQVLSLLSDCYQNIPAENQFDFIVSNPPYIPTDVVQNDLESCVKDYEPLGALDGGEDGLDFYRTMIKEAPLYLKEKGSIFFEIGYDQGVSVPALFSLKIWAHITCHNDLAGRPRVVTAQLI